MVAQGLSSVLGDDPLMFLEFVLLLIQQTLKEDLVCVGCCGCHWG